MKRPFWFLALSVAATFQLAIAQSAADLDLMKGLIGRYPVVDFNGNSQVTGVLEIIADSVGGVGYRVVDLVAHPNGGLATQSLITPSETTVLTREGDVVVQENRTAELFIRIEFSKHEEQVSVRATKCPKNGNCEQAQVNTSNSPEELISTSEFFKSEEGGYRIEQVGGETPHDGNDSADVSVSGSEANLTFPYCPNAGGSCDPGYLDLSLNNTKVYRKTISPTHTLYTIHSGGSRYTWENRDGQIYFRNYQYQLASGRIIVLTHVMRRAP